MSNIIANSAKLATTETAFYFANSKNNERASKGGKIRFYGPFESKAEAEFYSTYHNANGTTDVVEVTNEEREDAITIGSVIFHDLFRAAYFVDGNQVTPGTISKMLRAHLLG